LARLWKRFARFGDAFLVERNSLHLLQRDRLTTLKTRAAEAFGRLKALVWPSAERLCPSVAMNGEFGVGLRGLITRLASV